ncbi:hypothetical protein GJV80_18620 [Microlunatus sp. Gsoil 973]|nr:hypothetical protein GJV80_18620 [Microlunatus sp. Gsoil 973]
MQCNDGGVADLDLIAPRTAEGLPHGTDWIYEPKYDGYRVRLTISSRGVELRSRRGTDLTGLFPDVTGSAAVQVPNGTVLDGELVAFVAGRLSFDTLQQRMAAGVRRATDLARVQPASLVVFDVLQTAGQDITGSTWRDRRAALEDVAQGWRPPLQLTLYTADRAEAIDWMHALAPMGIEGAVAKRATSRYRRGADWLKVRYRDAGRRDRRCRRACQCTRGAAHRPTGQYRTTGNPRPHLAALSRSVEIGWRPSSTADQRSSLAGSDRIRPVRQPGACQPGRARRDRRSECRYRRDGRTSAARVAVRQAAAGLVPVDVPSHHEFTLSHAAEDLCPGILIGAASLFPAFFGRRHIVGSSCTNASPDRRHLVIDHVDDLLPCPHRRTIPGAICCGRARWAVTALRRHPVRETTVG